MDLAWTNSLDQLWRSPTLPMWLILAAAALFAVVFLVIVLRADRSVANGALAVMTLLAVAIATAAATRSFGVASEGSTNLRQQLAAIGSLPALSCIDDLAGDSVEAACEKVLFGAPDHIAAGVSYAAARLDRLTALGDVASASKVMTPELQSMRRAIERDRYGLMAHVMVVRDGCTAAICPAFQSLTDRKQIVSNIEERAYDGLVERYSASWSGGAMAPASANPAAAAAAIEPAVAPTGKPTNAEFPTAASIPPVSIMTPEPPAAGAAPTAPSTTPSPVPRPAAAAKAQASPHQAQPKRRPNPPQRPAAAASPPPPVQLAPQPSQ